MRVIGTAGHIDHGKSALVRRLTGIDPDRLSEEKQRGMTIDLGFAWLTLPSGTEVSVVDVPGHERFIRNMLAGAGGIDVALLVVAADELIMPQTREHLEILGLLDVRHGVVALSKTDLVDDEWLRFGVEEVKETLARTRIEGSEIVPVSAITGQGMPDLAAALERALARSPMPADRGRAYLPIDRAFTLPGFGTIVTGTLHDGRLAVDTDVELMPGARPTRIRSLQTHRRAVDVAEPGSRVAVNVTGYGRDELERGDVLAARDVVMGTARMDVDLRVLESAPFSLRHGMRVDVHIGAAERAATLSILDGDAIEPGRTGWVQLRFDREVAAIKDQKIIIRLPAPARTVAGGVVVDPAPRHRRSDPAAIRRLEALASSEPSTAVLAALSGQKPRTPEELVAMTGLLNAEVAGALEGLEAERRVLPVGGRFLTRERWEALRSRAVDALRRYHAANPLKLGMSAEELRTRVGWRFGDWAAMLRSLADSGVLRQSGALVALPTHAGGTGGRRTEVDAVLTALRRDPFAPPSGADLQRETGADGALLAALVNEGEIVRISPDVYLDRSVYADLVRRVLALIAGEGPVTVAQVRDHFGTSRKYALAFMEHLDDERITRRVGDTRVAGSRAPACA